MIKNILQYFIKRKLVVTVITIVFIVMGIASLKKIPREGMPSIDLNQVSITTILPGASAEDIELNVTVPLEEELREVSGLEEINSVSMENSSSILIQIDESMGQAQVRNIKDDIQKAVDRIDELPDGIKSGPTVEELLTSDLPILEIALAHKNKDYLRTISKDLEEKIEKLNGVAGVDKVGYFDREIHIEVDPKSMNEAFFSLPEIVSSIEKRNIRSTSGTLESYKGFKNIVILNKFQKPMDVADVILRSNFDSKHIKLKEIADVNIEEENTGLIVRNKGESGISLLVKKKINADIVRTIARIKALVEKELPGDINYSYVSDQSKTTRTRIKLLVNNGIIGFILVLIFLFIFLNKKAALWTSFGIPFCFIAAFSLFSFFGITLSAVALSGLIIVLGIVVDDAIVISEKAIYYQESGVEPHKASLKAVTEMAGPITASAITTIFAYIPIFYIGGRPGKFLQAIPFIVIIILFISLFESFFLLPSHLSHGKTSKKTKPAWIISMEEFYGKLLQSVLRIKYIFVVILIAILCVSLVAAKKALKIQMFPQSNIDTFYVKVEAPKNFSLSQTEKITIDLEKSIAQLSAEELISYTSRIGHQSTSKVKNYGDHENQSIITVFLTPDTRRTRTAGEIIRELKNSINSPKGVKVIFDRKKIGALKDKPVAIHLRSNDRQVLLKAENKVMKYLKKMKKMGVTDVDSDRKEGKDELVIDFDHIKMAALGLTTADVAQVLKIAYDGEIVSSIQTIDEDISYRVILNKKSRKNQNIIRELGIKNSSGVLIKLKEFVSYKTRESDQAIYHRNGMRNITVTAEVSPKKITAVEAAKHISEDFLSKWDIPDILDVELGGEFQKTKEILGDVKMAALIAIFLIFCTLAITMNSFALPLIIMSVIPFGVIGIIFALLTHGQNISMFVLLAVISLSGIVVNDSIIMVDTIRKNLANISIKSTLATNIAESSRSRLRPILLTTITTLAGLIPMAYGLGGYEKMLSPMALAFSWGLLFATTTTLFLIPCLYMIIDDMKRK